MIGTIEARLGQPVGPAGSLTDLNHASAELLANARTLPEMQQIVYLRHLTPASEHRFLASFIEACVKGDAPVDSWGRGRIVSLTVDWDRLLSVRIADQLAPLAALGPIGALAPHPSLHHMVGAPAVALPTVDYRWMPPEHLSAYAVGDLAVTPVADPRGATQAWLNALLRFRLGTLAAAPLHPLDLLRQASTHPIHSIDALRAAAEVLA